MNSTKRKIGWGVAGMLATSLVVTVPPAAASVAAPTLTPAGTPQGAGPVDGRIVFNSNDCQLYTINPDGTALVQVTHFRSACLGGAPSWSPDGAHLVFGLFRNGEISLYTTKADGTGRHLVTSDGPGYLLLGPDYTPDGQRIVYSRCRPTGGCAIYSIGLDGNGRQQLTPYPHCDCNGVDQRPQVSPNGQWITFNRLGSKGIASQVWLMRIDGTDAHPITAARLNAQSAHWAPNGDTLYFHAGPQRGYGLHVFKTTISGGRVKQLTFSPWPNGDFSTTVSPSGSHVGFISDRRYPDACCNELFTMTRDGTNQQLVTGDIIAFNDDWGTAPLQHQSSAQVSPPSPAVQLRAAHVQALVADTQAVVSPSDNGR